MNRIMALVERDMRKFLRSPALMLVSMVFPLVQLIVLGNAFGGKIKDASLGVVDHDRGVQSLRVREALDSIYSNARTMTRRPRSTMFATASWKAPSSSLRNSRATSIGRTVRESRWWWITATTS